ncbi:expressed unknown protein [Seminavis robusta]|uniref:Uncharacterized protein n=1 Tax=Seminavis robusta TaxID=568900 RepID=A0A9N8EM30_9STRA|nr:expressed unknown protein [Seminavis robusta]|eukprot:Sro1517_g279180.1 n/a (336) ;mRNA; r:22507-23771
MVMSNFYSAGTDGPVVADDVVDLELDVDDEDPKDEKTGEEDIENDKGGVNELEEGSFHESVSIDSAQEREDAVREGFVSFFVDKLGCTVFAPCLEALDGFLRSIQELFIQLLDQLLRMFTRTANDVTEPRGLEVADAMEPSKALSTDSSKLLVGGLDNASIHSTTSTGGFGGAPIGTPGVAEMAASAAQGAATSSASGVAASASVAGVSAAGLTGATTTLVGAVASTSLITQAGVAVGATLTAAALSVGVIQSTSTAPTPTPESQSSVIFDAFVPPVCSDAQKMEVGFIELQIKGIPPDLAFNPEDKQLMEFLFRDIYNDISVSILLLVSRLLAH